MEPSPSIASSKETQQPPKQAIEDLGGPEALSFLRTMVELDTTNLEDPSQGREEKRHYREGAEAILRQAKTWGLSGRIWEAREELPDGHDKFAQARPNVIIDLDRGARSTLLILAHFDVVPVPDEQLERWKSPPHKLTFRSDGRFYGRGSNDDLGSGVVGGLVALHRLAEKSTLPVNVRFFACCDEETGGAGGIEALREHDAALPPQSTERLLRGDMALLPDGSPYVAAGSSGVSFVDIGLDRPASVTEQVDLCEGVIGLHTLAQTWTSRLKAPDFPGEGPHPHITGRATVTKFDLEAGPGSAAGLPVLSKMVTHSDAANQIPAAVTLTFVGTPDILGGLRAYLSSVKLADPYRLKLPEVIDGERLDVRVTGVSGHGGYPHRAKNPVPVATKLLRRAAMERAYDPAPLMKGQITLDLRSPPEMEAREAFHQVQERVRDLAREVPGARASAPASRVRSGYALAPELPLVARFRDVYQEVAGRPIGIFGEYGGTDASAFRDLRTPAGHPLPAVVFGSMDHEAHIHDAEEGLVPSYLREVEALLVRFVETWTV